MANTNLYETVSLESNIRRCLDITISLLLISLHIYRLLHIENNGVPWILAFFCELCFSFSWILVVNVKWSPLEQIPRLELLDQHVPELPGVDMFVTTADPVLEPPIITVNTVLSLLAVDYPANKLACYVSDDGCSPLVYHSLVEATHFAKRWVPFCKKYSIQVRAPFRYLSLDQIATHDTFLREFQQDWTKIKDEYEQLAQKLDEAANKTFDLVGEFEIFSGTERGNHPPIIKVVHENKEGLEDGLPHLIYISREKRPKNPHNYKAGAMNVLTRVSGLMSNAPFMLNVDCDMYANNPQIVRQAMCLDLGSHKDGEYAYVQSPQLFYDNTGNELSVLQKYMGYGLVGIQGPFYNGTGCFHRRDVIYGLSPQDLQNGLENEEVSEDKLIIDFGSQKEFAKSVDIALRRKDLNSTNNVPSKSLEAAYEVASSSYEYGTSWGTKFGWIYGSTVEDINTGLKIQSRGWKSLYCSPEPPAFLGCAPPGGPESLGQQERWSTGLLEILLSNNSPVLGTLNGKLQFRMFLAYLWVQTWALRSIPELCYTMLPAYCIINNSRFLPEVHDSAIYIPISLFVIYNLYTMCEYLKTGLSINIWWQNQIFARIKTTSPWLFGLFDVFLKLVGYADTVFIVTNKDTSKSTDDEGIFIFDDSAYFVPGTTILLVHMAALFSLLLGWQPTASVGVGSGFGEVISSLWVFMSYWPFVKGLFGKGKYGIPMSTIWKSAILAFVFVQLSRSRRS